MWCGVQLADGVIDIVCQNLNFLGIDSAGAFQAFWNAPLDRLHRVPDALG